MGLGPAVPGSLARRADPSRCHGCDRNGGRIVVQCAIVGTDIVVIGAGPAGLAVAATLRRAAACVVLVAGNLRRVELAGSVRPAASAHHPLALRPAGRADPATGSDPGSPATISSGICMATPRNSRFTRIRRRRQPARSHREWLAARHFRRHPGRLGGGGGHWLQPCSATAGLAGRATFTGVAAAFGRTTANPRRTGRQVLVVAPELGGRDAVQLTEAGVATTQSVRTPPKSCAGIPSACRVSCRHRLKRAPESVMNRSSGAFRKVSVPDFSAYGLPAPAGDGFSQFLRTATVPILDHGFVDQVRAGRITVVPAVDHLLAIGSSFPMDRPTARPGHRRYRFSSGRCRHGWPSRRSRCAWRTDHERYADLAGIAATVFRRHRGAALRPAARDRPRGSSRGQGHSGAAASLTRGSGPAGPRNGGSTAADLMVRR